MNYPEISKETIGLLYQCYNSLKKSPLNRETIVLVELRVSQINGCLFCIGLHTKEAKELNIAQEKIDALASWQEHILLLAESENFKQLQVRCCLSEYVENCR